MPKQLRMPLLVPVRVDISLNKIDNHSCKWLFEFILETEQRFYIFRCATRKDRDYWVRVF